MRNLIPYFIYEQFTHQRRRGTLVAATLYVDVSGFTQLTEQLMRHRKEGAEVLSATLNHVFAPLIEDIYAHAGFITAFAGDAFTAVFPMPAQEGAASNTALYALHSACFIRDFFSQHGHIATKYGNFTVNVKVGLAFGNVAWHIIGTETRHTYYFYGPAIQACTAAERHAQTGHVVADASIWPHIQSHAAYVPAHQHYRLTTIKPPPLPKHAPPPKLSHKALAPFVLDPAIALVNSNIAEFRRVAAIFIAFDIPPEDMQTLQAFGDTVLNLATDYQGYFNKMDFGDKGSLMVILFGAPVTHEQDLSRAVDFVLALKAMSKTWPQVSWKAGITHGTVYAGPIGGQERSEYGALGDVMNLACRMMQRAPWGQIWVSEHVATQLSDTYQLALLGAHTFKGKSIAMRVYHLTGKKALVETLYTVPMVGRHTELESLQAAVQPIVEGHFGGLTCVYGEAGIGKTRLIHSLRQRIRDRSNIRWLTCPADPLLRQSLNPFKYMLRGYFHQRSDTPPAKNRAQFDKTFDTLCQRVTNAYRGSNGLLTELQRTRSILAAMVDIYWEDSLYAQLEPTLRFENTLAALKTLVEAETTLHPVIVHIDDGQWLDEDSRAMIQTLLNNIHSPPLALIFASRHADTALHQYLEEHPPIPWHILDLETLAPDAMRAIAEHCLQGPISKTVAQFLMDKTDGNPFFVEQLTLNLHDRDILKHNAEGTWTLAQDHIESVPATLNAVLVARLDRLAVQVRQTVQTAAVLGREFEIPVLARMCQDDAATLQRKLHAAEQALIWSGWGDQRYIFRHALLRDAAYDMQMPTRLRALHQRAAEAIAHVHTEDLTAHYADLAYHYDRAAMPTQAAHWYQRAGEQSAEQFANAEAISYLSRALDLTPESDHEQRYAILLTREQVYNLRGLRESQYQDLVTLKQFAREEDQIEVALREAHYAEYIGEYETATTAARQAVELAQATGRVDLEVIGHLRWGRAIWRQGHYAEARPRLEQALNLARTITLPAIEADSLRNLGNVLLCMGEYNSAMQHYQQALPLYRDTGNKQGESATLNNIGIALSDQGDYASSRTYGEQALAIKQNIGDRTGTGIAYRSLANIAYHLGEYDQAHAYFEHSLQMSRETGDQPGQCEDLIGMAQLAYQTGDYDAAHQHSQQALDIAEQVGDQHIQGYILLYLGHALVGLQRLSEAQEKFEQAVALRKQMRQHHLATEALAGLASIAQQQGNSTQALKYVKKILPYLLNEAMTGTRDPFHVYLICYDILEAAGDARAAKVLASALHILQEQAANISDPALRVSFLTRVPTHQQLLSLQEQSATGDH